MFDPRDPRGTLSSMAATASAPAPKGFAGAEYLKFYETEPDETATGSKTWFARGQNFVVAYSDVEAGASFARTDQPDEYMLLLPDKETRVEIATPAETVQVDGNSLTILPPGASTIKVTSGGRFIRLFSSLCTDLLAKAPNNDSYAQPHPNVALLEPWPEPPAGYKVRAYSLDVPKQEGRFGRIWRSTNFMVNWSGGSEGPRDTKRMSPHSHPDFEQCSLIVEGEYMHHLRWPWTPDYADWREDEHVFCGAPSVTVIPPPSIHTSQGIGAGLNSLIDIFSPPRHDFSEKPGWVLNADEYPTATK